MRFIAIVLIVIMSIFIIDMITGRKLINPYKLIGIFGKPGSGKSTFLTKLAYQHAKRGWDVYTNDPTCKIPGIKYFDDQAFKAGKWLPDGRKGYVNEDGIVNEKSRNIVLFVDEIGSLYNNREFKTNLNEETLRWWAEHRHRHVKVFYGSQSYKDMDLKIRQKSDRLYLIKRGILKNFSVARPINIIMDIQNPQDSQGNGSGGGQIVELYTYDLPIFWKFILLRKWIKKFDSYR